MQMPAKQMTREPQASGLDWARIASDLDEHGCATTGPLLAARN